MKLLLRAQRDGKEGTSDSCVLVGGPDTVGREEWLWDLTVEPMDNDVQSEDATVVEARVVIDPGNDRQLTLRYDSSRIEADLGQTAVPSILLDRDERELVVLVAHSSPVTQGAHVLEVGDVLVVEGDYPALGEIHGADGMCANLSIATLRRRDGRALRWIP